MCIKIRPDPEGDFVIPPRRHDRLPPRDHFSRTPSTRYVSTELRSPGGATWRSSDSTVLTSERAPRSSYGHKRSTSLRTPTRGSGNVRHSSHSIPAPAPLLQIPQAKPALPIPAGQEQHWINPPPPAAPSPPSSAASNEDTGSEVSDARTRVSSATSRSPQMSDYKANKQSSTKHKRRDDTPAPPRRAPSSTGTAGSSTHRHSHRRSVVVDNGSGQDRSPLPIEGENRHKRLEEERIYHEGGGRRRKQYHYR
ncbi:MAG: hypothetical protein M1828_000062 [Chrysothrix sp. TS-e1954]|nr:MAG: hypothetical protein M1828_000062 [Chrysothrix sp. TS-e1954]